MTLENPFQMLAFGELFQTLLPDFVLAFTFFTALTYAVLGKRFDHQRSAAAMSVALGFALSVGLVWWEQGHDLSIRDLGPIAIVFVLLVLGITMFYAIRLAGGALAGVLIALGACVLMALIFGMQIPIDGGAISGIIAVSLAVGAIAFFFHHHGSGHPVVLRAPPVQKEIIEIRRDMADVHQDEKLSSDISQGFRKVEQEAQLIPVRPEIAQDAMTQLQRLLPAEGWLTERLAHLRAKAHHMREGHAAELDETREVIARLPPSDRRNAADALSERYRQLIDIDQRLERLDRAVAENERRIRELTQGAEEALMKYDYRRLVDLIQSAEKLQDHNTKLFKIIDRTERKLTEAAEAVARQYHEVSRV